MRRMFAFARSGFLPIRSHVASAAGLLASPQKLKSSWDFFRSKLHDIKEVQRQAYVEGESFGLLDPIAFNDLIAQLERSQSRWAEASDRVKIAREKWDQLHTEYVAKRQQIIRLLRQMPESAHWALFRLSRWYPVEAAEA
jgi:gas vesicle protein